MHQLQDILDCKMIDLGEMYEYIMKFHLYEDVLNRHLKCPHMVIPTKQIKLRDKIEWLYENIDCLWYEQEHLDGGPLKCAFADPTTAMAFKLRWV